MFKLIQEDSSRKWVDTAPIKLVWTDPPFGTGKTQDSSSGYRYRDGSPAVSAALTIGAIEKLEPFLTHDAVVCVLADYRVIHTVIVELSEWLYFQGEVIWTFGLGRPRNSWWPNRHNTIATFTASYTLPRFNAEAIPRERRKAPKAGYEGDKPAGSVWDKTMSNTDSERVGYPNQKPLDIIVPFVLAHTNPGDLVADPFMGSASTGHAALLHRRHFVGQDNNPQALEIAHKRLAKMDY